MLNVCDDALRKNVANWNLKVVAGRQPQPSCDVSVRLGYRLDVVCGSGDYAAMVLGYLEAKVLRENLGKIFKKAEKDKKNSENG